MHFDPAQRCLTASVRELLAAALPSRAGATASPWRARLGELAHARYRALRAAEVEVVASEAPLSCAREVAGYHALVRKRADVIVREPDGALAIWRSRSGARGAPPSCAHAAPSSGARSFACSGGFER